MKANLTIFAMFTTIALSSLFALSPEKAENEGAALYELGINLGMGRGCKKDPMRALETMKASARLGYGPAALVCAMAMETETGWLTTVTADECGTNVVTAASRLRAYIGTADIGGWYDIHKGRPYVSSLGQNLADDKFVERVRAMYQHAKDLGSDFAEEELKRFEATVAWQREIVARRRQRQEAAERRAREHKERQARNGTDNGIRNPARLRPDADRVDFDRKMTIFKGKTEEQ